MTPDTDVMALAALARIDVSPDAARQLTEQLPRIIDYVGQLQAVPTEAVAVVAAPKPQRDDVVKVDASRLRILEAAPARQGDFWSVKAVL